MIKKSLSNLNSFWCLVTCCCLCSSPLYAGDAKTEESKSLSSLIHNLQDKDHEVRVKAANLIHNMFKDATLKLLTIASSEGPALEEWSSRRLAIDLLGYIGTADAVPFLIKNITFAPDLIVTAELFPGLPCVKALVSIGKPASLAALAELSNAIGDERRTLLLLKVIKAIEGPEVGAFMLKREIRKADTKENQEALSRLLPIFEKTSASAWD